MQCTYDRKKRLSLLIGITLVMLHLSPGSSVAHDKQGPENPHRRVVRKVQLKPRPGTEVVLPDFTATVYSDDSVSLSSGGSHDAGMPPLAFNFEADIKQGTYKTRREDVNKGDFAEHGEQSRTNDGTMAGSVPALTDALAVNPGDSWGKVRVIGRDPAWIVVNQTTNSLSWRVFPNGTVTWLNFTDKCFAANPSAAGTHWFTTSCSNDSPWFPMGSTTVQNNSDGSYTNWDFGRRDWATSARAYLLKKGG